MRESKRRNVETSKRQNGEGRDGTARPRRRFDLWIAALLHAVMFALAFPPFDLWITAFVAPAPLAWVAMNARTTRGAMALGFAAQLLMWLWLVRWMVTVTAVGYPFLCAYLAVHGALLVWVFRRVSGSHFGGKLPLAIVLPVIWTGMEFFRGDVLFHGYPWYLLGHPLIGMPVLVQSADVFGAYFASFLVAMVAGMIVDVWRVWGERRTTSDKLRTTSHERRANPLHVVFLVVAILVANIGYGMWRMGQTGSLTAGPRVLAIQTNLPQDNKKGWSEEDQARDLPKFMALTRKAIEQTTPRPDVVVWPETMVPGIGFEADSILKIREIEQKYGVDFARLYRWPAAVSGFQREIALPMVVGSESWIDVGYSVEGNSVTLEPRLTYNSAYLVEGELPFQRYDKSFLTPFGETMPYISSWPWLENLFLRIGVGADLKFNLASNPEITLLELGWSVPEESGSSSLRSSDPASKEATVRFGTPICFEDTAARVCRRMVYGEGFKRCDAFVNISNDGWFAFSDADRRLHAQIARFRCIENRVPMIRSVNTGCSVAIDSCGRVTAAADGEGYGSTRREGWVSTELRLDSRVSLYGRVGDIWPWGCLMATVVGLVWTFVNRKERQHVSSKG